MQKMQEETQMVYQKYGISPTGSCIQMLIQMPILFALYRVFLNVPAYVLAVKEKFSVLVTEIMSIDGFADKMTSFVDKIKIAGLHLLILLQRIQMFFIIILLMFYIASMNSFRME